MPRFIYLASLFVAAGFLGMVAIGQSSALSQNSPTIDFALLYHAAQIANDAYEGESDILGKYPGKTTWVATPGDNNVQYYVIYNDERKIQAIAVRGTVDDTNWDLDMDTRGIQDQKAGILMHHGFRIAAETIYHDVKPQLKPGYTTYLTGHSLGGAVAAILGIYLLDDKVKLGGVFTFGQPKFTNVAGARAYANLPLVRVIYQNDTVTLLPNKTKQDGQQYAHVGAAINLLSGPHYVYATEEQALEFSPGSLGKLFGQISVPDHQMKWYLEGLREKLDGTVQVSFADRNEYIVRHKRGKPTGQQLKPQYNFRGRN